MVHHKYIYIYIYVYIHNIVVYSPSKYDLVFLLLPFNNRGRLACCVSKCLFEAGAGLEKPWKPHGKLFEKCRITHMLHVWYIYHYLSTCGQFWGKCSYKYSSTMEHMGNAA